MFGLFLQLKDKEELLYVSSDYGTLSIKRGDLEVIGDRALAFNMDQFNKYSYLANMSCVSYDKNSKFSFPMVIKMLNEI